MNEIVNTNATEIAENVIDPIKNPGGGLKNVLIGVGVGVVATIGTTTIGKKLARKFKAHKEEEKASKIHRIDCKDDIDKDETDD